MTLAAVRSRKKLWKTSLSRSWTSTSASLTTRSPETRVSPTGKVRASSPRAALARRPAVRRLRIVCSSSAEIGVDDVNVGLAPAEIPGALHQRVLEAEAFLVADDLGWRRLPDVDDRLARQMRRLDQLGFHGASPSARRQSGR